MLLNFSMIMFHTHYKRYFVVCDASSDYTGIVFIIKYDFLIK